MHFARVPSGPEQKRESKPYPSSQTHRIQSLRGRVGGFFKDRTEFFAPKRIWEKAGSRKLARYTYFKSSEKKLSGLFAFATNPVNPSPSLLTVNNTTATRMFWGVFIQFCLLNFQLMLGSCIGNLLRHIHFVL